MRIALTALLMLASAGAAAAQDVGGAYTVEGKNLNGTTYSGTAEITLTSETTCRIVWETGVTTSTGICMRNENAFAAGYVLGNGVGLVIYQIMEDGSMQGIWTVADTPGVGYETLTPAN